jgi:hypothetical protein
MALCARSTADKDNKIMEMYLIQYPIVEMKHMQRFANGNEIFCSKQTDAVSIIRSTEVCKYNMV